MTFETLGLVLAVWIFGSMPLAVFVGRFIRLGTASPLQQSGHVALLSAVDQSAQLSW